MYWTRIGLTYDSGLALLLLHHGVLIPDVIVSVRQEEVPHVAVVAHHPLVVEVVAIIHLARMIAEIETTTDVTVIVLVAQTIGLPQPSALIISIADEILEIVI
jgi:hypothetical protein